MHWFSTVYLYLFIDVMIYFWTAVAFDLILLYNEAYNYIFRAYSLWIFNILWYSYNNHTRISKTLWIIVISMIIFLKLHSTNSEWNTWLSFEVIVRNYNRVQKDVSCDLFAFISNEKHDLQKYSRNTRISCQFIPHNLIKQALHL